MTIMQSPESSDTGRKMKKRSNRMAALPALTKIIATLGPASSDEDAIRKLIETGVSVFRLNFSHGDLAGHGERLALIRDIAKSMGRPTAVLGDLPGPKIRVRPISGGSMMVEAGAEVVFRRGHQSGEAAPSDGSKAAYLTSTYAGMVDDVEPGQRVLINDGAVRMLVLDKTADALICSVTTGGEILTGKGVNLPETDLSIASITKRDWECVAWAVEHEVDMLALSFVRSAEDVRLLKEGIERNCKEQGKPDLVIPIIAKIELPGAVEKIEAILQVTDGIMVARGDLGVEMDPTRVPVIQKLLVKQAQRYGKPCVVATQMLESMIHAPTPTRAECTDVANAIFEGTDAVMLSGETAVGKYPVMAVDHMRRIAEYTEQSIAANPHEETPPEKLREQHDRTAALAHGVWTVAQDVGAKFIVAWSQTGEAARLLSQNNFHIPIIAVTTDLRAARQMHLYRGVVPVRMKMPENLSEFTHLADAYLIHSGWAEPGDPCVLVAGWPLGVTGVTNRLAVHVVGDMNTGFAPRQA